MIAGQVVVAVIVQPRGRVLQVFDMPVILVQRVVDEGGVLEQHAHPQQEEGSHEQRVGPGLLGEIVVDRDGVLQYPVTEPQGLVFQIVHLALGDVQVPLVAGVLIQRDEAMSHRAGVDGPLGQAQLDVFVHTVLHEFEVLLLAGDLVGLADAVIGHTAGPVPGHVHPHRARHHGVDGLFDLCFVKNQSCHLIISPFAIRPRGLLRQLLLLCTPSRASSWPFQTISVQFRSFINWGVGRFLHDSGRFFHVFRADLSVSHKLCTFGLYELHINRRFWQRRVVFSADRAYNGAILSGRRIRHVPAAAHRH